LCSYHGTKCPSCNKRSFHLLEIQQDDYSENHLANPTVSRHAARPFVFSLKSFYCVRRYLIG